MHSLTLNIWPKAMASLFSLFKWEILNRSIFNSGWHAVVFSNKHLTSPRATIFPWQKGQVFHLCLPRDVNTPGRNLSHRNTGQIPPAAAHISSSTLSWALEHSLCCSLHGRSSVGGWGMQCWQHCSYKRLLLVFLVISRTGHTRITLPLEVF